VATALGIREGGNVAREVLLDALRDRRLSSVLDTCEHLIESCASLADDMLRRAPAVRILATTREALGYTGRRSTASGSLAVPDRPTQGRAPRSSPDATRSSPIAPAPSIRTSLHPWPTRVPSSASVAASTASRWRSSWRRPRGRALTRADRGPLHDRFRLLTGGARTAVARQRTLEATVDWSCQLLSDTSSCF
jgi:predicted ATPase